MTTVEIFTKENLIAAWEKLMRKRIKKRYNGKLIKKFSEELEVNINILLSQLETHTYQSKPSQLLSASKGIILLSVEDMIISYVLYDYLVDHYSDAISLSSYAYQKDKSIFTIVDNLKNKITNELLQSFVCVDITDFFGAIDLERMKKCLEKLQVDEYVICLIQELMFVQYPYNGRLKTNEKGLIKGCPVSPILSNLYMIEFDELMSKKYIYGRYSDDIFVALKVFEEGAIIEEYHLIESGLKEYGFEINTKKSSYGLLSDGADFLGARIQNAVDNELDIALRMLLGKIHEANNESLVNSVFMYDISEICKHNIDAINDNTIGENIINSLELLIDKYIAENQYNLSEKVIKLIRSYQEYIYSYTIDKEVYEKWVDLFDLRRRNVFIGSLENGMKKYQPLGVKLDYTQYCKVMNRIESLACQLIQGGQVKYVVYDIDIDKKVMIEHGYQEQVMQSMLQKALTFTKTIQHILNIEEIHSNIEYSGYKGYHLWVFFKEVITIEEVKVLHRLVKENVHCPKGLSLECLPLLDEEDGELIKVPYTYHERSHTKTWFLGNTNDQKYELSLELFTKIRINKSLFLDRLETDFLPKPIELEDKNVDYVVAIEENCHLIKCIVQKGIKESYLNHFERNALLYVYGHMGNAGERYLHQVISHCINYDQAITEGFLNKIKEYPVSCKKLQTRFPEYCQKCTCDFSRYPLFYPSPVIHGVSIAEDKVTHPDYVEHKKRIAEVLEVQHNYRIGELTKQMVEITKEQQKLVAKLDSCKNELQKLFDLHGFKHMDTEYGRIMNVEGDWIVKIRM